MNLYLPPVLRVVGSLLLFVACTSSDPAALTSYTLVQKEGIYVEQFPETVTDETRYTANNELFTAGSQFIYAYEHLTPEEKPLYFEEDSLGPEDRNGWRFVETIGPHTIKHMRITVLPTLSPFDQWMPDYYQTVVFYEHLNEAGEAVSNTASGVIENEQNIWMHPPRGKYFRILEPNPFPFIMAPYEVGTRWEWSLVFGGQWGDARWKTWEGNVSHTYAYQIMDKQLLDTPMGELECLVVEATLKEASELGTPSLKARFHPTHGFVRLDYVNVDGSQTRLRLVQHKTER